MALHFSRQEYAERQARACEAMAAEGLDSVVLFRQESMYYLTGYDSEGFVMFQGLYMTADGRLALLTRTADRLQSRMTSVLEDVRIWQDHEDAHPAEDLREMVRDLGGSGKRFGIEYHAYGLTGQRARAVDAAFDGFAETTDASDLVRLLRLVQSPAELAYVRKAGALADAARDVALGGCVADADLGAVYGDMLRAIMAGGGDPPASGWPVGSGEEALFVRYHTGLGSVRAQDQVTFEFAAPYRHYHAATMFAVLTGAADARHRAMFAACREALEACEAHLRPGNTVGEVFDTHARSFAGAGFGHAHLAACGYTMGATYAPSWSGLAHAVYWQPAGPGAGHGVLPAHDIAGRHHRAHHVAGRDRHRDRGRVRARDPRPAQPADELTRIQFDRNRSRKSATTAS